VRFFFIVDLKNAKSRLRMNERFVPPDPRNPFFSSYPALPCRALTCRRFAAGRWQVFPRVPLQSISFAPSEVGRFVLQKPTACARGLHSFAASRLRLGGRSFSCPRKFPILRTKIFPLSQTAPYLFDKSLPSVVPPLTWRKPYSIIFRLTNANHE